MADRGPVAPERVQAAGALRLDRRGRRPQQHARPGDPHRGEDEPRALTRTQVEHAELAAQPQHGLEIGVVVDGQRAGHPGAREPDLVRRVQEVRDRARVTNLDDGRVLAGRREDAAIPEAERDGQSSEAAAGKLAENVSDGRRHPASI